MKSIRKTLDEREMEEKLVIGLGARLLPTRLHMSDSSFSSLIVVLFIVWLCRINTIISSFRHNYFYSIIVHMYRELATCLKNNNFYNYSSG